MKLHIVELATEHHDSIVEILKPVDVMLPYFGHAASAEQIARHVRDHWVSDNVHGRFCLGISTELNGKICAAACLNCGQLSYFVGMNGRRLGYAKAVIRAICTDPAARRSAPIVTANVYRDNARSRALLECLGFRFKGLTVRTSGSFGGRAELCYALLAEVG